METPEYPFFKANFDVAVFKTSSSAGIGVIIRDGMGEAIGALTMPIPLANSVATMEALALGMTTGRIRAGFLYVRTRHAGLSQKPEPAPFNKWVFFLRSILAPSGPTGPAQPITLQGPIRGPIKKKI